MIGYFIHGRGSVRALLLHGWFDDGRVFETVLAALDPEVFKIAVMDYRGYGDSSAMPGPFDISTAAVDAEQLADHLGWGQFAVIGHSMGGKVALRLAANRPTRVTRILALTPVWAGAAPFDADTLAFFRSAVRDIGLRAAILDNTTGGRLPKFWSTGHAARSFTISTIDAFAGYFESWALEDFADEARRLRHDTLVVVGGRDAGVSESTVRATWLAELPNARAHVLAETGHYPMLEAPLAVAGLIEGFLAGEPEA